jgi:hypothetical protein
MMDSTLEHLMSQIEEQRKNMIESIGEGAAKTFDDYRYAAGVVRGLLIAQSLVADLAKNMENFDD